MDLNNEGIACCFDRESMDMYEDYRKHGLAETAKVITNSAFGKGLARSTVLEIGCGIGALSLELVERGAASAVGIDLSPKMVHMAKTLAAQKKLTAKVSFILGDGASAELPRATTVILDAVLCCYPDVKALLENSSSAAEHRIAISFPDDTRFLTRLAKTLLPFQGIILRRDTFRFFIHPSQTIKKLLWHEGFKIESESKAGWIWSVCVFTRD